MEELIIQRVNELMDSLQLKIRTFSNAIGIPESTVKQQLNGKTGKGRGIKIDVITAILTTYPNVSAEWLLRGEGEMERQSTLVRTLPNKEYERTIANLNLTIDLLNEKLQRYEGKKGKNCIMVKLWDR